MTTIKRNDDGEILEVEETPVDIEGLFRSRADCQSRIDIATEQMAEIDEKIALIQSQALPGDNVFTPDQIAVINSAPEIKP